eukprot:12467068-Alexandrium_andersonii.AAC.1
MAKFGNGGTVTAGHAGGRHPVSNGHLFAPADALRRTLSAAFTASWAKVPKRAHWQPSPLVHWPFAQAAQNFGCERNLLQATTSWARDAL